MANNKASGHPLTPIAQRRISVTVGLTYSEIEKLEAMAAEKGITRGNLIRIMVVKALNKK
jgi:hypothetical protein